MEKQISLTILLPMHNEEKRVERCVEEVEKACRRITDNYEIIIAEDGSKDSTYEVAKRIAKKNPRILLLHSAKRLGRGRALSLALRKAKGEVSVYMDADLSSNITHLGELVSRIRKGAVIATGSRMLPTSSTKRSIVRGVASKAFNFLVRALLGSKLYDHQCGFKAFNTKKVKELLNEVEDRHWFWDTELLVRAQRKGLRVDEIPIEWSEKSRASTVDLKKDVAYMASKILYLKGKIG